MILLPNHGLLLAAVKPCFKTSQDFHQESVAPPCSFLSPPSCCSSDFPCKWESSLWFFLPLSVIEAASHTYLSTVSRKKNGTWETRLLWSLEICFFFLPAGRQHTVGVEVAPLLWSLPNWSLSRERTCRWLVDREFLWTFPPRNTSKNTHLEISFHLPKE